MAVHLFYLLYGDREKCRLFGMKPLLKYWVDFVPMGFVAYPEKGVVYLDTGNSDEPGIIDHHFAGHSGDSACEMTFSEYQRALASTKEMWKMVEIEIKQGDKK